MMRRASRPPIFWPSTPEHERADDGADKADEDGEAKRGRGQVEDSRELLRGAGDDGGIEAEEQAAQRADDRCLCKITIQKFSDRCF